MAGDPFSPFFQALRGINDIFFSGNSAGGVGNLSETYRRNIQAIENANRVLLDGAVEAARRQATIFQKSFQDLSEAARSVSNNPPALAAQADTLRHAVETAIGRVRDMNEALTRSNLEALELLRDRLVASFDELTGQKTPAAKPAAAKVAAAAKPAAKKAAPAKPVVAKAVAKKPAAKKVAAKKAAPAKPVAAKAVAKKPVAKPVAKVAPKPITVAAPKPAAVAAVKPIAAAPAPAAKPVTPVPVKTPAE